MELKDIMTRQASFVNCETITSSFSLAKNGFVFNKNSKVIECICCNKVLENDSTMLIFDHFPHCIFKGVNIPSVSQQTNNTNTIIGSNQIEEDHVRFRKEPINYAYFKDYNNRLKSFFDWPKNSMFDIKEFARCGLFYIGINDKVACFSCRLKLSKWECHDIILEEHRKYNPDCFFVQSLVIMNEKNEINTVVTKSLEPIVPKSSSGEPDYKSLYEALKDKMLCSVCMVEDRSIALLPCGHVLVCESCGRLLHECPLCRAFIRGTVRVYLS